MRFLRHFHFVLVFFCLTGNCFGQYIQVDDTYGVQQLIENVLINSPCANASNFTVMGDPFSSGQQSFGYFNAGTSGFPFAEGIVLSTARAKRSEGPNNNLIDEGLTSWLGDSDLEDALNITGTFNATVMEFDFTPLTSKISFDYIFASEEYQGTAPCRYSDGFAFLLKEAGSADSYKNLAVIPNTTTPVLVTTVHPDIPGRCPAINENYFGGYNGSNAAINFNGQTTVLTAKSDVIPGRTYHIKLVIADHENIRYDSAIFLGGGSFDVGTDLGQDQLIATNNPVCANQTFNIQTNEIGSNSYKWFKDNVEIPLATNSNLIISTPGTYSVEITLGSTTCIAKGEIVIEYAPAPTLTTINVVQCDEDLDGSTLFNLTKLDTTITNNDPNFGPVRYFENLFDAQNQVLTNAISNLNSYSSSPKTIYATVTNNFGCLTIATISLQVSSNAFPNIIDFETCDLDNIIDGFYAFQLSDIDAQVLNGLPTGLVVTYYPTYDDALLQTNLLPSPYTNETQYISRIYAKILDGSNCYGIQPVDLYVNSNSPSNFEDQEVILCDDVPLTVSVATTFFSYNWSNDDNDFSTQLNSPGEYTVIVTNRDGCEATKKFIAITSGEPTITSVDIDDFQGDSNSININVTGLGAWEYSIDGINYQDSSFFSNVLPGEYQVHVRDQFLCGDDTFDIFVMNYPTFFTPNNDTYNDVWIIENIEFYPNAVIQIFDRFGKLLKQIAPQNGWDGTFMGEKLPSDDYWFVMQLNNSRTVKGHFSLKR